MTIIIIGRQTEDQDPFLVISVIAASPSIEKISSMSVIQMPLSLSA
jgi:hypothetical protein